MATLPQPVLGVAAQAAADALVAAGIMHPQAYSSLLAALEPAIEQVAAPMLELSVRCSGPYEIGCDCVVDCCLADDCCPTAIR
jgi:hypothetical protein